MIDLLKRLWEWLKSLLKAEQNKLYYSKEEYGKGTYGIKKTEE